VDARYTAEQLELHRAARQLTRELGPSTVADLDDETRKKRLAGAVRDAGWLELRDDAGGAPLATGVEVCIIAEALGAAIADVAFSGPILGADLARRLKVEPDHSAVLCDPTMQHAIDCAEDTTTAYALHARDVTRSALGAPFDGTDLTRVVRPVAGPGDAVDQIADADASQVLALGLALTSADLVGVMRGVLEITVEYAKDRKQYGAPIGSFQAVQHLLAESCTLSEGSRSVAQYAAWAVDSLPPAEAVRACRVAKVYCATAARTVCETAIQVHGGIGNTWEHIAHVFLRRAFLSTQWFGDDVVHLRELAVA
jgi:alkylation response protein AidB-like acyl-CoA dehydrogenase